MMRQLFFLRQKWIVVAVAAGFWGYFHLNSPWDWTCVMVACGWLAIHRRKHLTWHETLKSDGEIFLSPIDGRLVAIRDRVDPETGEALTELRIQTAYYHNWGLYLPSSAEMDYLKLTDGGRFQKIDFPTISWDRLEAVARTDLVLRSKSGHTTKLCFPLALNNRAPRVWMKSGDRGRGAACFGYYPFGGSLIVFVPKVSDILVVLNERITAGRTVLAVFRPTTEEQHGL